MSQPVDQQARDRIRLSLHESLFIEAGAGTGKTRSLIERLVELIRSGVELHNIAAITFTEAAAAELKDRLRQAIEANASEVPRETAEFELWQRALHQLDGAAIQTLHSFAQRILAAHPLEAGLPPGFQLLDGVQSGVAFDDRWRSFLDAFLGEDGPEDLVEVLLGLGVQVDGLRSAAKTLSENWDRLEAIEPESQPRPDVDASGLIDALDELCGYIGQNLKPDKLADALAALPEARDALKHASSAYGLLRATNFTRPPLKSGRKEHWPDGMIAEIRDTIATVRDERDELRQAFGEWCAGALLIHLRRFALEYAEERRRAGTLDFHDLLTLARNLLRSNDDVRHAVHRRFQRVLIDEFQDTDPLQIEIASLVVRPIDCPGDVPWHEAPVPPGSLVVVGDPKQSIYRFRRADIHLYLAAASRLSTDRVELVQNWRSVPSVLDWVNEMFAELIGLEPNPAIGQPAYVDLHPGRPAPAESALVHWFGGARPNAEAAREEEAAAIAKAVLAVKDQAWRVRDDRGATAGARFADIAILFPRRTILPELERIFEARGIPYRVESRSLLYETQEVIDLGHILTALSDPTDEVATVAALRSPAFACSDRNLLEWKDAGGRWDYTSRSPANLAGDHPVARAMEWLRDYQDEGAREPVNRTVEMVIRERRLLELAFGFRRPRERWQRYRFVLEQARAFASTPGASLRGFVSWMRRQADEGADVVESAVPEPDDDAVRLMTVHASKGLEFPVVVLAGLGSAQQHRPGSVLWDDDGRPGLSIGSITAPGFDAMKEQDKHREEAEYQRVLYVAATRACDHLLVSLYRGDKNNNHAARLAEFVDGNDHLWRELQLDGLPDQASIERRTIEPPAEDRQTWTARREASIAERRAGPAIAATTIARRVQHDADDDSTDDEPFDDAQPWKRGRAGTHIGRAVHAVLQTIELASGEGLEAAARAQAYAEGVQDRVDEVQALVRAALAAPAVKEAVDSGRYWREVFIATQIHGHLVEGFIDLLYERDGALIVVDYKTDALRSDADIDAAVSRYRLQAASYALALERQLDRRVHECRFVFLSERRHSERSVPNLRAAIDEVEQTVRDWR